MGRVIRVLQQEEAVKWRLSTMVAPMLALADISCDHIWSHDAPRASCASRRTGWKCFKK